MRAGGVSRRRCEMVSFGGPRSSAQASGENWGHYEQQENQTSAHQLHRVAATGSTLLWSLLLCVFLCLVHTAHGFRFGAVFPLQTSATGFTAFESGRVALAGAELALAVLRSKNASSASYAPFPHAFSDDDDEVRSAFEDLASVGSYNWSVRNSWSDSTRAFLMVYDALGNSFDARGASTVLGPWADDEALASFPIGDVLSNALLMSYSATATKLDPCDAALYFARVAPLDSIQAEAMIKFVRARKSKAATEHVDWNHVMIVATRDTHGSSYIDAFDSAYDRFDLKPSHLELMGRVHIHADLDDTEQIQKDSARAVDQVREQRVRVILVMSSSTEVSAQLVLRGKKNNIGRGRRVTYIFTHPSSDSADFRTSMDAAIAANDEATDKGWTTDELLEGSFAVAPSSGYGSSVFARFADAWRARGNTTADVAHGGIAGCSNDTDSDGNFLYRGDAVGGDGTGSNPRCLGLAQAGYSRNGQDIPFLAATAFDAVYSLALAFAAVRADDETGPVDGSQLATALRTQVSFPGVTGFVSFSRYDSSTSRVGRSKYADDDGNDGDDDDPGDDDGGKARASDFNLVRSGDLLIDVLNWQSSHGGFVPTARWSRQVQTDGSSDKTSFAMCTTKAGKDSWPGQLQLEHDDAECFSILYSEGKQYAHGDGVSGTNLLPVLVSLCTIAGAVVFFLAYKVTKLVQGSQDEHAKFFRRLELSQKKREEIATATGILLDGGSIASSGLVPNHTDVGGLSPSTAASASASAAVAAAAAAGGKGRGTMAGGVRVRGAVALPELDEEEKRCPSWFSTKTVSAWITDATEGFLKHALPAAILIVIVVVPIYFASKSDSYFSDENEVNNKFLGSVKDAGLMTVAGVAAVGVQGAVDFIGRYFVWRRRQKRKQRVMYLQQQRSHLQRRGGSIDSMSAISKRLDQLRMQSEASSMSLGRSGSGKALSMFRLRTETSSLANDDDAINDPGPGNLWMRPQEHHDSQPNDLSSEGLFGLSKVRNAEARPAASHARVAALRGENGLFARSRQNNHTVRRLQHRKRDEERLRQRLSDMMGVISQYLHFKRQRHRRSEALYMVNGILWSVLFIAQTYILTDQDSLSTTDYEGFTVAKIPRPIKFVDIVCYWLVALDFILHLDLMRPVNLRLMHTALLIIAWILVLRVNWLLPMNGLRDNAYTAMMGAGPLRFLTLYRTVDVLKKTRLTESTVILVRLFLYLISTVCMIAGFAVVMEGLDQGDEVWKFHDGLYFGVVTISTVGYGDFALTHVQTRVLMSFFIVIVLVSIPGRLHLIQEIFSRTRIAGRLPGPEQPFVLMTGAVSLSNLRVFLEEFYHKDHSEERDEASEKLVIVCRAPITREMQEAIMPFEAHVCYISGRIMDESVRSLILPRNARHCFVLAEEYLDDLSGGHPGDASSGSAYNTLTPEDLHSRTLANIVHRVCPGLENVMVECNDLGLESNHWSLQSSLIVPKNMIRARLMAANVLAPGFSTILLNALHCSQASHKSATSADWHVEYLEGAEREVYVIEVPDALNGLPFFEVAYLFFRETGLVVMAVRSGYLAAIQPEIAVLVAPSHYRVRRGDKLFIFANASQDASLAQLRMEIYCDESPEFARHYGVYRASSVGSEAEMTERHQDRVLIDGLASNTTNRAKASNRAGDESDDLGSVDSRSSGGSEGTVDRRQASSGGRASQQQGLRRPGHVRHAQQESMESDSKSADASSAPGGAVAVREMEMRAVAPTDPNSSVSSGLEAVDPIDLPMSAQDRELERVRRLLSFNVPESPEREIDAALLLMHARFQDVHGTAVPIAGRTDPSPARAANVASGAAPRPQQPQKQETKDAEGVPASPRKWATMRSSSAISATRGEGAAVGVGAVAGDDSNGASADEEDGVGVDQQDKGDGERASTEPRKVASRRVYHGRYSLDMLNSKSLVASLRHLALETEGAPHDTPVPAGTDSVHGGETHNAATPSNASGTPQQPSGMPRDAPTRDGAGEVGRYCRATAEKALLHDLRNTSIRDHVIVSGNMRSLAAFAEPLCTVALLSKQAVIIVLMVPRLPTPAQWCRLQLDHIPHLYVLKGSPTNEEDLQRAALSRARHAVFFRSTGSPSSYHVHDTVPGAMGGSGMAAEGLGGFGSMGDYSGFSHRHGNEDEAAMAAERSDMHAMCIVTACEHVLHRPVQLCDVEYGQLTGRRQADSRLYPMVTIEFTDQTMFSIMDSVDYDQINHFQQHQLDAAAAGGAGSDSPWQATRAAKHASSQIASIARQSVLRKRRESTEAASATATAASPLRDRFGSDSLGSDSDAGGSLGELSTSMRSLQKRTRVRQSVHARLLGGQVSSRTAQLATVTKRRTQAHLLSPSYAAGCALTPSQLNALLVNVYYKHDMMCLLQGLLQPTASFVESGLQSVLHSRPLPSLLVSWEFQEVSRFFMQQYQAVAIALYRTMDTQRFVVTSPPANLRTNKDDLVICLQSLRPFKDPDAVPGSAATADATKDAVPRSLLSAAMEETRTYQGMAGGGEDSKVAAEVEAEIEVEEDEEDEDESKTDAHLVVVEDSIDETRRGPADRSGSQSMNPLQAADQQANPGRDGTDNAPSGGDQGGRAGVISQRSSNTNKLEEQRSERDRTDTRTASAGPVSTHAHTRPPATTSAATEVLRAVDPAERKTTSQPLQHQPLQHQPPPPTQTEEAPAARSSSSNPVPVRADTSTSHTKSPQR